MQTTLSTYLGITGLALDFMGASLLAYDVLYGWEARVQARISRRRLVIARRNRERLQAQLEALKTRAPEKKARRLRSAMRELKDASDIALTELRDVKRRELRGRRIALAGFVLMMCGFAVQLLAYLLAQGARH